MRTIFYSVIETKTMKKTSVGVSLTKAEQKLAELQKANPNANYRIIYKWGSI